MVHAMSSSQNCGLTKWCLVLIILQSVQFASSCDGYGIEVDYARNCPGVDGVIKLSNFTVELDENCRLIPKGCVETSAFSSAQLEYYVWSGDARLVQGKADLCAAGASLGTLTTCPVAAGSVCGGAGRAADVRRARPLLALAARAGRVRVEARVQHDGGRLSCVAASARLVRRRSSLRLAPIA